MGSLCSQVDQPEPKAHQDVTNKPTTPTNKPANLNERHLISSATFEKQDVKIITLGSGECGKTTLWRQLKITYCGGFKDAERRNLIAAIREMIIGDIKTLIDEAERDHQSFAAEIQSDIDCLKDIDVSSSEDLDSNVAQAIKRIWNDPMTKLIYERANSIGIGENISYFLDNVERIAEPNYKPTDEDLLKARIRTTGRNEIQFKIDNIQTVLVDVGGQKNERRNWARSFQSVDYVLFIVSLSDFDQNLFEEKETSRTSDSVEIFTHIANSAFPNTPIFLVLNKHDLFVKKLQRNPDAFLQAYQGFTGNVSDPEACLQHVKQTYLSKISPDRSESSWIHSVPACAMDQLNVRELFQTMADKIVAEKHF